MAEVRIIKKTTKMLLQVGDARSKTVTTDVYVTNVMLNAILQPD